MPTLSHQGSDQTIEAQGRELLRVLGDALGAEGGSVYFVEGEYLRRLAALDPGHAPSMLAVPLVPESPFGQAYASGAPVLARDDLAYRPSGWEGYRSDSFLVLPVQAGESEGEVTAVVSLHDKTEPPFTLEDARVGGALARRCAESLRGLADAAGVAREARRAAALFDVSSEAILVLDVEQRVLRYNPAAETLFGWAPEHVLGQPVEMLIPDRYREGHRRYFAERLAANEDRWPPLGAAELRVRRVDGSERACEVRLARVSAGATGGDDGVELVICLRDISATVRMTERLANRERELMEAQRMAGAGLLAESVVVDLRERIEGVIKRASAALERVHGDAITARHLEEARKAGRRALEIASQLGSFAEAPSGELEELDLNEVIAGFAGTLQRLLGAGLSHNLVLQPGLYKVRADRPTVEHILANLALHCRETLAEGRNVTVHTANVRRPDVRGGDVRARSEVHLIVEDDGPGLGEEERELLLGVAGAEGAARSRQLGLAVVFSLVERCGGEVVVGSQRGRGTRFCVQLPAVGAAEWEGAEAFFDETLAGNETVLLVDEDAAERRRLALALKEHRYKVIQAGRAEEALQLIEDFPDELHIVVAHHAVPDMGGNALLERVQVFRPMTALLLSGTGALAARREEGEEGASDSPTHPALLLRAVRVLLDRVRNGEEPADRELTIPGLRDV
jgi:PAS domain S-box-containing protein